ncbi:MAG: hypothetical protein HZY76_00885 [Anaerolineae bacterium]|nr:MAG: hypothetical protein HZY76_00885 [Anaerolineae bacterium]
MRDRLMTAGTQVHAIALGEGAHEDLMRRIATDTCGAEQLDVCYHHLDETVLDRPAVALSNPLADLYTQVAEDIAGLDRLWEQQGAVAASTTITETIPVPESGVADALFAFHWSGSAALGVVLRGRRRARAGPTRRGAPVRHPRQPSPGLADRQSDAWQLDGQPGRGRRTGGVRGHPVGPSDRRHATAGLLRPGARPAAGWPTLHIVANLTDDLGGVADARW